MSRENRCFGPITCDGEVKDCRIYQTYYSPESIAAAPDAGGFRVEETRSGLCGGPWRDDFAQMGILCRKRE